LARLKPLFIIVLPSTAWESEPMRDECVDHGATPPRRDGQVERWPTVRPYQPPASYAPLLPRLARGEPSTRTERRARPRLGEWARGRLVDLLG
jgi:hypothetical protein